MRRKHHETMELTCKQLILQALGFVVMVFGTCSRRDIVNLIVVETIITHEGYVSNLFNHVCPLMSIVNSNGLGQF